MKPSRSFASDNYAGVHPEVLEAIRRANEGHVAAYGDDPHTESAMAKFREHFGADVAVFFVFNGTAANVLSLQALTRPFHAVLCPELSHIYTDECGAPEKFTGCKLVPLAAPDGKLTLETVAHAYHGIGDQHHVQPRVISITQSTEMGTVYKPAEIEALARFAHERKMFLHMDGARISNAVAAQQLDPAAGDARFGSGCAFVWRNEERVDGRGGGGFLSPGNGGGFPVCAQAGDATGIEDALHVGTDGGAPDQRSLAAECGARQPDGATAGTGSEEDSTSRRSCIPVEANGVFAQIPREAIQKIQERYFFYVWVEEESVVRWMCSFDTTEEDVQEFTQFVGAVVRDVAN